MDAADIKAIRKQIEAELTKREPLSTRGLRRLLRKRRRRLSMRQLGRILKDREWGGVEHIRDNLGRRRWVIGKSVREGSLPVANKILFFVQHRMSR